MRNAFKNRVYYIRESFSIFLLNKDKLRRLEIFYKHLEIKLSM